ncbi:hypothetical protein QAD02_009227, partial [Eretmocerus hayati]
MLRSLKFVQKLNLAVGPQRLASHRVAISNPTETRVSSGCYHCLYDDSVSVPYMKNHQHRRNYVTQVATQQIEPIQTRNRFGVFEGIDNQIKRHGKIFIDDVHTGLQIAKQRGNLTSSEALLLLRACGDYLIQESIECRRALTETVWQTIKDLGTSTDAFHYNAYILVNLENETDFSPVDILLEMKGKGIEPNRVTFQRLIDYYCGKGDIAGATKILEHMNEKGLPLNEKVFSSLIKGHSVSGDHSSAMKILEIMSNAGVEPTSITYTSILCAHARIGNIESIKQVKQDCQHKDIIFSDEEILEVVYVLAINKFSDLMDQVITILSSEQFHPNTSASSSYLSKLIHRDDVEAAYKLYKLVPTSGPDSPESYFIRRLVAGTKDVKKVISYCKLMSSGNQNDLLSLAIYTAFKKDRHFLAFPLLEALKESGGIIREHYFLPIFVSCRKNGDMKGINETLRLMISKYKINPSSNTIQEYVVPHITEDLKQKRQILLDTGISKPVTDTALLCYSLESNRFKEAANFIASINTVCYADKLLYYLRIHFQKNQDVKSLVEIVHHQFSARAIESTVTKEVLASEDDRRYSATHFSGAVLQSILRKLSKNEESTVSAILNGFVEKGMRIDSLFGEAIKRRMEDEGFDQALIDLVSKLMSDNLTLILYPLREETLQPTPKREQRSLEEALLRKDITRLSQSGNLEKIEEKLKEFESSHASYGAGTCCVILNHYLIHGKLNEAEKWYRRLSTNHPDITFRKPTLVRYANLLVLDGRVNDALEALKRFNYKGSNENDSNKERNATSNALVQNMRKTCPERVAELLEILESKKYFPSNTEAGIQAQLRVLID